jgi:hypothetical protein
MIFPVITCDDTVQVDDAFRIDASKSFKTPDESAIRKIEVMTDTGEEYITIWRNTDSYDTDAKYMDWQYSSEGTKTITLRINDDYTETKDVTVITATTDNLFSDDNDLVSEDSDIMQWLPEGRTSFKYVHRAAQTRILDWLDRNGFVNVNNEKFVVSDFVDSAELREWSTKAAMHLIYAGIASNQEGDVFRKKADQYAIEESTASKRYIIRLDVDEDDQIIEGEGLSVSSGNIFIR